ncbi:MAG: serine dehydratase, partial [Bacteroidota bacterium]
MEKFPSIFNDVIGPVMRGPSSSHCAASLRIGRLCRDLMDGDIREVYIEFDPNGSLATTHKGQGSDMGLFGGFLGWEAYDERLPDYQQAVEAEGINITIDIHPIGATHPNTYQITLKNERETHSMIALSTGGGMIQVIAVDSAVVNMDGDFHEILIYVKEGDGVMTILGQHTEFDEVSLHRGALNYIEIKSRKPVQEDLLERLHTVEDVLYIRHLAPVLPVLSRKGLQVPFITVEQMLRYNTNRNLSLWELATDYESVRGSITREEVFDKMRQIIRIMKHSVHSGLKGTHYDDRILGAQSIGFREKMLNGELVHGDVLNTIILYVSAIMEVKSSMGV